MNIESNKPSSSRAFKFKKFLLTSSVSVASCHVEHFIYTFHLDGLALYKFVHARRFRFKEWLYAAKKTAVQKE